ncbi:MAG: response regulator [Patescibacteria group bacterium]
MNKNKILLVDDDRFLLDMYSTKFADRGFEVVTVTTGQEALGKLAGGLMPVAVVTNIIMPTMDGFQLIQSLRDKGYQHQMAIIILSSLGQKEDIEMGIKLGIDGYIVKASSTPTEVVERIIYIIEQKGVSKPSVPLNQ